MSVSSVTRSEEISPLWQNVKYIWQFFILYWANFKLTLTYFACYSANSQMAKNIKRNLPIWSHWRCLLGRYISTCLPTCIYRCIYYMNQHFRRYPPSVYPFVWFLFIVLFKVIISIPLNGQTPASFSFPFWSFQTLLIL